MLNFIDFGSTNIVGIEIDGKITEGEFDTIINRFDEKLKDHEKVRLYAEMKNFGGMELKAFLKDLKFGLKNFSKFEREAVVTDAKWAQQFANIFDPLNPYADYTIAQMYDFLNGYEFSEAPGSSHAYSNLEMGLLGHILEWQ